jgi:ABC-type arginine/histidine transport system permease subunit
MEFEVIIKMLPLYFQGLWVTIYLVLLSLAIGLGMAIPLALLATSKKIESLYLFFPGHAAAGANVYDLPRHGAI